MEKPQVTVLDNGLTVITQHMNTKQVYANIAVGVGGRDEEPSEMGASHFLEHMLAHDTERFTTEERDEFVKSMRGTWNASTTEEKTDYYYRVATEYTEDAIQLLSDSLIRASLKPERLAVEGKAVNEEILSSVGNAQSEAYKKLKFLSFPGTGIDNNVAGDEKAVSNMTRESLIGFMDKYYTADKMVLTVVGDVDHDDIVNMAKKHFVGLREIPKDKQIDSKPAVYRGGYHVEDSAEAKQITYFMGFEGAGRGDLKKAATDSLLGSILGGGFSSHLMQALRKDEGLVYGAGAGSVAFKDNGLFYIKAGFRGANAPKVLGIITDVLNKFADTVTQKELDGVKNAMLGEYERAAESVGNIASQLVTTTTTLGHPVTYDEKIEAFKSITLDELKARAKEIFASAPAISAYGEGASNIPSYAEITRQLGQERHIDASGLVKDGVPSPDRSLAEAKLAATPAPNKQKAVG